MNLIKSFILLVSLTGILLPAEARRAIEYRDIVLKIESNSNITYAVAVLDKREVITLKRQEPDFVGYLRSATGIAYPIWTASGNTFADDVTFTISNAIQEPGAKVTQVSTSFSMNAEEVIEKLKATNADKLILVIIDEWRSDTRPYHLKVATEMLWNLNLKVFDSTGTLKAENKAEGRDGGIDPSATSSTNKIKPITDRYYKEKMEMLFSGAGIVENLK
ncbi:MAG: hypothetical protein JW973_08755 [Bacteroidales bacterium]|nr:hypothetical protein [Bacteroidales bacterium]